MNYRVVFLIEVGDQLEALSKRIRWKSPNVERFVVPSRYIRWMYLAK